MTEQFDLAALEKALSPKEKVKKEPKKAKQQPVETELKNAG